MNRFNTKLAIVTVCNRIDCGTK